MAGCSTDALKRPAMLRPADGELPGQTIGAVETPVAHTVPAMAFPPSTQLTDQGTGQLRSPAPCTFGAQSLYTAHLTARGISCEMRLSESTLLQETRSDWN